MTGSMRHARSAGTTLDDGAVTPAAGATTASEDTSRGAGRHRSRLRRKALTIGALLAVASMLLAGCGFKGLYDLPLPGGADLGGHPITVHAQLDNVYDLVPQASVKVDGVAIGKVSAIKLGHGANGTWKADVVMVINSKGHLPANTTASLRQTSLLGEKYVELSTPPKGKQQGTLRDDATVAQNKTYHHAEVEEVLGALSLLLNNGGLAQIKSISNELQQATSGNERSIRKTLDNVTTLVRSLDGHSDAVTDALDGLDKLSTALNGQRHKIADVIDNIGPGLASVNEQRDQLVSMLQSLNNLSGVTIDTVNKSQADLVADLKSLQPTLKQLAKSGKKLPDALQLLLTPPFTDYAAGTFDGDYDNLYANLDLDLGRIVKNLGRSRENPIGSTADVPGLNGLLGGNKGGQSEQPDPLPVPNSAKQSSGGDGAGSGDSGGGLSGLLGTLTGGGA